MHWPSETRNNKSMAGTPPQWVAVSAAPHNNNMKKKSNFRLYATGLILAAAVLAGAAVAIIVTGDTKSSSDSEDSISGINTVTLEPSTTPTIPAPSAPSTSTLSLSPTKSPIAGPFTVEPTKQPTLFPTKVPTKAPTKQVTKTPTKKPSTESPTPSTVTVSNYNIEIRYVNPPDAGIKAAFDKAVIKWTTAIVGDIPDVTFSAAQSFCSGAVQFSGGETLDDLVIVATIEPIDGLGNILGSAGPCASDNAGFARVGQMKFDSADVANLIASGGFDAVIEHEMGHVVGVGTSANWKASTSVDYRHQGTNSRIGHEAIGGIGAPYIEDEYGPGTKGGHWDEAIYKNELMTGFLAPAGQSAPMSALTFGALKDMGYVVDESAIEPFTKPTANKAANTKGAQIDMRNDISSNEVVTIHLDGSIFETNDARHLVQVEESNTATMVIYGMGVAAGLVSLIGVGIAVRRNKNVPVDSEENIAVVAKTSMHEQL